MTFSEAWLLVLRGVRVRRRKWKPGVSISYKILDRFVTLTIHFEELNKGDIVKNWTPYGWDFDANDWEVVADFTSKPTHLRSKRLSRYHRDPVI